MEGVMMRGRTAVGVAVRAPDGQIVRYTEPLSSTIYTSRIAGLPFIRGLVLLWETLTLGIRMLLYSANVALAKEQQQLTPPLVAGTLIIALGMALGLFFVAPLLLVSLVDRAVPSHLASNLLEGCIRLGIFVGYIWLVGLMPDVRRYFIYHGAEHKAINAYEAGVPLEVETVSRYSTAHRRCGTSFLLLVLVLSIFIFALLGRPDMPLRLASRIVLVPVIAAGAYELIRLGANHPHNPLLQAFILPGMILQRLTTREPEGPQIEVAIVALKEVLRADGLAPQEPAS